MHDGENSASDPPAVIPAWHQSDGAHQVSDIPSVIHAARMDNVCENNLQFSPKSPAELPCVNEHRDAKTQDRRAKKKKTRSLFKSVIHDVLDLPMMTDMAAVDNHHMDNLIEDKEVNASSNSKTQLRSPSDKFTEKKKKKMNKKHKERLETNKVRKVKQKDVRPSSQERQLSRSVSPLQEQSNGNDDVTVNEDDNLKTAPSISDPVESAVMEDTNSQRCEINMEEQVDPKTLDLLEKNGIVPLKKKADNSGPGRLKFRCQLCDCHCDLATVLKHMNGRRHWDSLKGKELDVTVKYMPAANVAQLEVISELVFAISAEKGLSEHDYKLRREIVVALNQKFQSLIGTCEFVLSGSSLSGFGLKDCDVNVVLKIPPKLNQAQMFISLFDHMKREEHDSSFCTNIKSHFGLDIPAISFTDKSSGCHCAITLNNLPSFQTSALLGHYANIDPRVKILGVAFRYWANLCRLDVQEAGFFPRFAFDLMLVYFLQQINPPVLPVLHELTEEEGDNYLLPSELGNVWTCKNTQSVGCLWHNLFEFYAKVFPFRDHVVAVKQQAVLTCAQKSWRGRKMSLEDPFSSRRSMTRNINAKQFEYIHLCLKLTYIYFGTPQTSKGPLFNNIQPELIVKPNDVKVKNEDSNYVANSSGNLDGERFLEMFKNMNSSKQDPPKSPEIVDPTQPQSSKQDTGHSGTSNTESAQNARVKANAAGQSFTVPLKILELMAQVHKDDLKYAFEKDNFTWGKEPAIQCNECHKDGHWKENCPDLKLPEIKPLRPLEERYLLQLSGVLIEIANRHRPSHQEIQVRNFILIELERFIKQFFDDAKLELFGSSCNGFGFRNSDLDICLTFTDEKTGMDLNFAKIVETIAIHLRRHRDFVNVLPIPTAKVPIVKCTHLRTGIDCDISLYNSLAQQNTRMLLAYSKLDYRVTVIGYIMKHLAKLCEIGDASRGCLSSYAYTLMVIYFLQQRNPPVIPVLQELFDKKQGIPEKIVEDCNVWFFDDLENLGSVWPDQGKNTENVGELWIGLLNFYAEEFNFKEYVVCIRQLKPLTRFEKLWNSKYFAIEDPFDLNHNLGQVVSRKMNTYIMKVFIRAREVFGFPLAQVPQNLEFYVFDKTRLADGPPPNDGRCRGCGRKGHLVRECPFVHGRNDPNIRWAKNVPPAVIMHGGVPFVVHQQQRRFVIRHPIGNNRPNRPTVQEQQQVILNQNTMRNVSHLIPHLASGNSKVHNSPAREAQGGSQGAFAPNNIGRFARPGAPLQAQSTYPRQSLPEANHTDANSAPNALSFGRKTPVQHAEAQHRADNVLDMLGNQSHMLQMPFPGPGHAPLMRQAFQNNPVAPRYQPIPRFAPFSPPPPNSQQQQVMNPNMFPYNCHPHVAPNYVTSGQLSFMNSGLMDTTGEVPDKLRQDATQTGMYPSAYKVFANRSGEQLDLQQLFEAQSRNQGDRISFNVPNMPPPFRGLHVVRTPAVTKDVSLG